jgi:hypothetical protein
MPKSFSTVKKPKTSPGAGASGRVFSISMKGIPKVDVKTMARLEAAARSPDSKKRQFPILAVEA